VPCVYWVQDIWPESATFSLNLKNSLVVGALNRLCGWIYRRADMVLVQSEAFPPMIARFGVPADRIRVLPNTAPSTYRPLSPEDAPKQALVVPQDGFRLMFAGNIGESQDFDTLIAAADLLRDRAALKWVIVGTGRDEARVKALIAAKNLTDRFHFVGRHPEEDMPYFFAHADAMIVSLRDIPIFSLTVPYKVQCYMACGKPIIAALNGEGARIVSESGAGTAVPAGDPAALAKAVLDMMQRTPAERSIFASSSRAFFEHHYTREKVYGDLERFLTEAVGSKKLL
ncbi:MAG: glycosyltransferase family 4 protein, partial [Rhodocyclaceae bacterium]